RVVGDRRVDVDVIDVGIRENVFVAMVALGDAEGITHLIEFTLGALADSVHVGQRVLLVNGDELGAKAQTDDRHVELLVGHACCLAWDANRPQHSTAQSASKTSRKRPADGGKRNEKYLCLRENAKR